MILYSCICLAYVIWRVICTSGYMGYTGYTADTCDAPSTLFSTLASVAWENCHRILWHIRACRFGKKWLAWWHVHMYFNVFHILSYYVSCASHPHILMHWHRAPEYPIGLLEDEPVALLPGPSWTCPTVSYMSNMCQNASEMSIPLVNTYCTNAMWLYIINAAMPSRTC